MSKKKENLVEKVMKAEEPKDVPQAETEEKSAAAEEATTPVETVNADNSQEDTTPIAEDTEEAATANPEAAESTDESPTVETEEEQEPSLEDQLAAAHQEAGKNLENWQRAVAELANYKRRQDEQRKRQRDQIKSDVLQGVVSALDDLDLAFQNLPEELDGQVVGWVEGFRLVQRKLDRILEDQNVMPIATEGKFDPNFHEAVSSEESDEHEDGDIIAELRKGYQIGSRIIRPALVRVAK